MSYVEMTLQKKKLIQFINILIYLRKNDNSVKTSVDGMVCSGRDGWLSLEVNGEERADGVDSLCSSRSYGH